ncbi:MAG: response regulator [Ramlibacter sp.]
MVRRTLGLPALVLLAGLALTWVVARLASGAQQLQAWQQFERRADVMQDLTERRLAQASESLRSLGAAYKMAGRMDEAALQAYAAGKNVGTETPWIRGYGLLQPGGASSGFVVRGFAPIEGYEHVPGQDLAGEPAKRDAVQQAIDTGFITATPPVSLVESQGTGWLLFMPLYQGHPRTMEQRRESLLAVFYLPLVAGEVLEPITDHSGERIAVRVFDDDARQRPLYDDGTAEDDRAMSAMRPIRFAGRRLSLEVAGEPPQGPSAWSAPWLAACAGVAVSHLLALLTWVLVAGRSRAVAAARAMGGEMERLALMVERARAAVFAVDVDGRLTWANKAFEDIGGVPRAQMLGRSLFTMPGLHVSLTGEQLREMREALSREDVYHLEANATRADGSAFWLEVALQAEKAEDGRVKGYYAIGMDTTTRKQAELRVQASEHLMRLITDNIPARISYWDAHGRCLFANRCFCEVYRLAPGELPTLHDTPRRAPHLDAERLTAHVREVLRGIPQQFEHTAPGPDGTETCWLVQLVPDHTEHGVAGYFSLANEVTELKAARDQALEGSRAKTRFLSSMSHEIRTPMNAVLGMLTLLRRTPLTDRQEDYAAKAQGAARSLLSLLNDVLDLSKIEAGRMQLDRQPFSLERMLSELSVVLAANVGAKAIEVLYDLDPQVPDRLVGDDLRLRQILINLGGNAVKFTSHGEVVLRTRLVARGEGEATIEFSVTDTGIGISDEEQQRLFGDFMQANSSTSRQFGGSGLGLTICRRLTDIMGSTLRMRSTRGQGSCFWFELTLPLQAQDGACPARREALRVLMVDDNELARLTLSGLAASLGWQAHTADSGEAALAAIARAAQERRPYDAVFLDWCMPGLDGWEASLRIRALPHGAATPLLVMVTAHGREILENRAAQDRSVLDGFLVKPVTGAMLRDAVGRAVAARAPQRAAAGASAAGEDALPLAGVRLLLAEDNPINQQIACELLAAQGAAIDVVENGLEAVERLTADGSAYDLVLMDLLMPLMGGLDATRVIRDQLGLRLPIVAMTANAMDADRAACLAAGMNDHVAKPVVLGAVVAAILRQLGRAAPGDGPPVAAPAARPPVMDEASAIARLGGDRALFDRMLPVFRRNLEASRLQLQAALDAGQAGEDLRRLVHTLKGMAGTMGAARLAEAAREAESQLVAAPDTATPHVEGVFSSLDETLLVVPAA